MVRVKMFGDSNGQIKLRSKQKFKLFLLQPKVPTIAGPVVRFNVSFFFNLFFRLFGYFIILIY